LAVVFADLGVAIGAGLISGSYPALALSGLRPAIVLRANSSGQTGSGHLRIILVVLQFVVSIGLGIAAIVVFRQIDFARNIDLGFQHNNVVVLSAEALDPNSRESLAQVLRSYPGVLGAALSNKIPFQDNAPLVWPDFQNGQMWFQLPDSHDQPGIPEPVRHTADCRSTALDGSRRRYDVEQLLGQSSQRGTQHPHQRFTAALFGYTPQQADGKTIIYNGNRVNIVGVLGT
jgi:putative ABC transport system permease protein